MNCTKRLYKTLTAVTLCFTVMITGGVVSSAPAHAASVYSVASKANNIISYGERFWGVRYQFAAPTGTTRVFDCSSFTQFVYKHYGIYLPRSSKQQARVGTYVPKSQLRRGDLVFFYSPIHHVAIYLGNNKILHTYGKPGVTISDMSSGWWKNHYKTARRVI